MSNLQLISEAVDKYVEQTGINLQENPFLDKVKGCDSPDAVLLLLQENMKGLNDNQDKNRRFIDCLGPVVQFVHAFSAMLGEAADPVSGEQSLRYLLFFLNSFPQGTVTTCKTDLRRYRCSLHCSCLPYASSESHI